MKVRADIALQVKSNDFLEHKSLIPREHVKGKRLLHVADIPFINDIFEYRLKYGMKWGYFRQVRIGFNVLELHYI